MYESLNISKDLIKLCSEVENEIEEEIKKIDKSAMQNSIKVLNAFQRNRISDVHFGSTTGYGYGDIGRDTIEQVFSEVLGAEDSLVRSQFISGTHALTVALFAFLRPGDTMLSICGKPYDTLDEVIGIKENASSLKSFGIKYDQIELINDDFDYEKIREYISKTQVKIVYTTFKRLFNKKKYISRKIRKISKTYKRNK